jgi:hypothetical protein
MSCCRFLCFYSRLTCGLLKKHRTPQQLCCFIPTAPVQYQLSSLITMIVSREQLGYFGFSTKHSRDILLQAKGDYLPLRSDGSRDDQAGEAGTLEP